jgi:hypothetical protein
MSYRRDDEEGNRGGVERHTLHRMNLLFKVETKPGERNEGAFLVLNLKKNYVWIPKSPCAGINIKSHPSQNPDGLRGLVNLGVPEWLAKKAELI